MPNLLSGRTRSTKGGVVEAASPWSGATRKSDLYAGDAMDLYAEDLSAMVGSPLEGWTALGLRRCKPRFSQGSVRHEGKGESRAASSASFGFAKAKGVASLGREKVA
jgi:hypothetical protein